MEGISIVGCSNAYVCAQHAIIKLFPYLIRSAETLIFQGPHTSRKELLENPQGKHLDPPFLLTKPPLVIGRSHVRTVSLTEITYPKSQVNG